MKIGIDVTAPGRSATGRERRPLRHGAALAGAALLLIAAGGTPEAPTYPPAHPLPAFSLEATSKASAHDDDRTLDNTTFAFTSCGADSTSSMRRLLRLRVVIGMSTEEEGQQSHLHLDVFDLPKGQGAPPVITIDTDGVAGNVLDDDSGCLFSVDPGYPDLEWSKIYHLGTGKLLFESQPAPLPFKIANDEGNWQSAIAGFAVPPDDEKEAQLADKHVVGLLALVLGDNPPSKLLVKAGDPERAAALRNYSDERRYLALADARSGAFIGGGSAEISLSHRPLAIAISFAAAKTVIRVPFNQKGQLVMDKAVLPKGLTLERWQD